MAGPHPPARGGHRHTALPPPKANRAIRPKGERSAQGSFGIKGTEGDNLYACTKLFFQAHRGLDCAGVSGIQHLDEAFYVQLTADGVDIDRSAVGRLFNTSTDKHATYFII